jgi:hypothetical protein
MKILIGLLLRHGWIKLSGGFKSARGLSSFRILNFLLVIPPLDSDGTQAGSDDTEDLSTSWTHGVQTLSYMLEKKNRPPCPLPALPDAPSPVST